jgi:hypothetical protein
VRFGLFFLERTVNLAVAPSGSSERGLVARAAIASPMPMRMALYAPRVYGFTGSPQVLTYDERATRMRDRPDYGAVLSHLFLSMLMLPEPVLKALASKESRSSPT